MSVIQVLDSTKSGRAIYIVTSTLLAIALAPIILPLLGIDFELTVDSMINLVPIIGGLSLLFLGIKIETITVERIALWFINRKDKKSEIRVQMATTFLYVAPWESSPKQAYSIDKSLNLDLERMLRSLHFGEQISELQQVFWILFLMPVTMVVIIVVYPMSVIVLAFILLFGLLAASLIWYRNRKILDRIISYTYANWFYEGTFSDLSRREASFRLKSRHKERLEASLDLTKPVIDLVTQGDWKGFDRKSRDLEHLVGIPGYDSLSWSLVENYLRFLEWCATNIHGIHSSHIDIFLKNGRIQVNSSISVLRECRKKPFSEEEEQVMKMFQILTNCTANRNDFLVFDEGCYMQLEKESLKKLKDGYFDIMGQIPFKLNKLEFPIMQGETKGIDRLSWYIVSAAEQGLLDMPQSLSVVASWGTHPTTILSAISSWATKAILENDVGFTIDQLTTIARTLGEQLLRDDRTNPNQVLKHLKKLGKSNSRGLVIKYVTELCVDSIRTESEEPMSGLEAITRFRDKY